MGISGLAVGVALLAGVSLGPVALLIVPVVILLLQLPDGRIQVRGIAVACIVASIGVVRTMAQEPAVGDDRISRSLAAEGVVAMIPVPGGEFERVVVDIERIEVERGTWVESSEAVLVYIPETSRGVSRGDRVHMSWDATPASKLDPGYRSFVTSQGASASAWAWRVTIIEHGPEWLDTLGDIRRRITTSLERELPGDAGALAAGIVTGDDSGLSEGSVEAFRRTGTTHLTAVSGQNVALLIAFCGLWMRPRRPSTRVLFNGVLMLVVWSYVLMVGLEPPAIRAATVATLTLAGLLLGRRSDPLTLLALTLGAMALIDPGMASSVSFWLSAAASWALCGALHPEQYMGSKSAALDVLKGVTAANIATLPIILWTFGAWSPVSLLANVLVGPVMSLAFPANYVLAIFAVLFPPIAPAVAWAPGILLDLSIAIVDRLSAVSGDLHIPVTSPGLALVLAFPCFGALLALSRDGVRWQRIVERRWHGDPVAARALASGLMLGIVLAGTILLLFP